MMVSLIGYRNSTSGNMICTNAGNTMMNYVDCHPGYCIIGVRLDTGLIYGRIEDDRILDYYSRSQLIRMFADELNVPEYEIKAFEVF